VEIRPTDPQPPNATRGETSKIVLRGDRAEQSIGHPSNPVGKTQHATGFLRNEWYAATIERFFVIARPVSAPAPAPIVTPDRRPLAARHLHSRRGSSYKRQTPDPLFPLNMVNPGEYYFTCTPVLVTFIAFSEVKIRKLQKLVEISFNRRPMTEQ
jgi:hypothetical protein